MLALGQTKPIRIEKHKVGIALLGAILLHATLLALEFKTKLAYTPETFMQIELTNEPIINEKKTLPEVKTEPSPSVKKTNRHKIIKHKIIKKVEQTSEQEKSKKSYAGIINWINQNQKRHGDPSQQTLDAFDATFDGPISNKPSTQTKSYSDSSGHTIKQGGTCLFKPNAQFQQDDWSQTIYMAYDCRKKEKLELKLK